MFLTISQPTRRQAAPTGGKTSLPALLQKNEMGRKKKCNENRYSGALTPRLNFSVKRTAVNPNELFVPVSESVAARPLEHVSMRVCLSQVRYMYKRVLLWHCATRLYTKEPREMSW